MNNLWFQNKIKLTKSLKTLSMKYSFCILKKQKKVKNSVLEIINNSNFESFFSEDLENSSGKFKIHYGKRKHQFNDKIIRILIKIEESSNKNLNFTIWMSKNGFDLIIDNEKTKKELKDLLESHFFNGLFNYS